jgi:hypothetical protein
MGNPGTRRRNSDPTSETSYSIGHVPGSLFVPDINDPQPVLLRRAQNGIQAIPA